MEYADRSYTNVNHSPLMFDSDEDLAEEGNDNNTEDCEKIEESPANAVVTREERLLAHIRLVMTGVPPPPSFTSPKLDTIQILKLWSENQHLISNVVHQLDEEKDSVTSLVEEAKNTIWPNVLQIETFDVHYNKSKASEDLEYLCSKYRERYVGNETASWISALSTQSPGKTASAKKRARYRGWGHSPGRRLSHLARRRQIFTSANLQNLGGSNAWQREKKTILVDTKKPTFQQKKPKNSSVTKKSVPVKNNTNTLSNPKRALFQSPDDKPLMKPKSVNVKQSPNTLKIQRSKRALWPSDDSAKKKEFNSNGKRVRSSVTPSPRKKCNRNLFCDSSTSNSKTSVVELPKKSRLSNPHQKKLLWAISQALREEGIRMNHKNFQSCLTVLNGPCLALWLWKTTNHPSRGSTSENMLAMVKEFDVKSVIEQVKDNSSPSHLMSLRLHLVKKVEQIKSNTSEKVKDKIENSEVKENILIEGLTTESDVLVCKNTPLKDNNVLCEIKLKEDCKNQASVKTNLFCDSTNKSNLKSDSTELKPHLISNSAEVETNSFCDNTNKTNLKSNTTDLKTILSCNDIEVKTNILSDSRDELNLANNLEESKSCSSEDKPFMGFTTDSDTNVPSSIKVSNPVSFSNLLSWNADPISRLHFKAPNLNVVSKNGLNTSENVWKVKSVDTMLDISRHTYGENIDEESSTIEFVVHDEETQSSSSYSLDLSTFVDDSRTCFDFPNVHNIPCASVAGFEET